MIILEELNVDNWLETMELSVSEEQKNDLIQKVNDKYETELSACFGSDDSKTAG